MKWKLKRNPNNLLQKNLRALRKLQGSEVEFGHFSEQGTHYSGYSYPQLMAFHHNGSDPSGVVHVLPRPLILILKRSNPNLLSDSEVRRAFKDWSMRLPSQKSNRILLDSIGRRMSKKERDIFGDVRLGVTSNPTPLVLTGDLRDATSYKDSMNSTVRK